MMPASPTPPTLTAPAKKHRAPSLWVPSLYFAQGIPYVMVMTLSVVMYKRLGISNSAIAFYTSWLYLPWVIKPIWSPLVDITWTKRFWVVTTQFLVSAGLGFVAVSLLSRSFLFASLLLFGLIAFASATHDIAADGFYMLSLSPHEQAWWVGMRSTFYRAAMLFGSGLLVVFAGMLEDKLGKIPVAWSLTLGLSALLFLGFSCWHTFVLPRPETDYAATSGQSLGHGFLFTLKSFFEKPGIGLALAFMLLYRFDEAQLVKVISPFLLDSRGAGGLGLTTSQVGLAYGTVGVAALTGGGLLGGFTAAKYGLKTMLPYMVCSMYLPKLAFIFLSLLQPAHFLVCCGAIALEQLGYGFGFTAFMLYLLYFSKGPHPTAHYAMCTGFMALGMMIPGLWSGWLAEHLGYRRFFIWVLCSAVPGFVLALRLKVDSEFGKKPRI